MKKTSWKARLFVCSIVVTALGFIPWEDWLNIEIRTNTLQYLTGGGLTSGGIFLFIYTGFLLLLKYTKGFLQGVFFLLFPFVLLVSGAIWLLGFVLPSAKWSDEYIYQNGSDYVIVQVLEAGFVDVDGGWRIIRTTSPAGGIRMLEEIKPIKKDDNIYNSSKSDITFSNKIWHKISMPDE